MSLYTFILIRTIKKLLNFLRFPNYGWYYDYQEDNKQGLTPGTTLIIHGWYIHFHKNTETLGKEITTIRIEKTSLRATRTSKGWL